jgi:hypothetical protein
MPYTVKGKCIFKKDSGAKVGCTKGDVNKYLAALHANADESVKPTETLTEPHKIKGGKADNMTTKDIADKFDVAESKIEHELRMGKKVEREHTNDTSKATEIVMDHLSEIPDYYTRLAKMEKEALKYWKRKELDELDENSQELIKRLVREKLRS